MTESFLPESLKRQLENDKSSLALERYSLLKKYADSYSGTQKYSKIINEAVEILARHTSCEQFGIFEKNSAGQVIFRSLKGIKGTGENEQEAFEDYIYQSFTKYQYDNQHTGANKENNEAHKEEYTLKGQNVILDATDNDMMSYLVKTIESGIVEPLHKHNSKGDITGVYDYNFSEYLKYTQGIFFYAGTDYLYSNGVYKQDGEGKKLKGLIKNLTYPQFVNVKTINRIYDLLKIDASLQKQYEELNKQPLGTIAFQNGLFDVENWEIRSYEEIGARKLNIINQIPHDFDTVNEPDHDKIDTWLDFICPAADDKEMLLQYIGLCLTNDTRQQKFLILKGSGGNGKSVLINLISAIVGADNITNMSLETIVKDKFMVHELMGKLVNSCSDIKTVALDNTDTIKNLVGEDSITADVKYSPSGIKFKSYAKLIFSANEIPIVKGDHTNGFYRKLLVLEMSRLPAVKNPNLYNELLEQLNGFIWLAMKALQRMYAAKLITISKNSERLTAQHQYNSDTVSAFIHERLIDSENSYLLMSDLSRAYKSYCEEEERQPLGRNNFFKALEDKGYYRTGRKFKGLAWKPEDFEQAEDEELPFS